MKLPQGLRRCPTPDGRSPPRLPASGRGSGSSLIQSRPHATILQSAVWSIIRAGICGEASRVSCCSGGSSIITAFLHAIVPRWPKQGKAVHPSPHRPNPSRASRRSGRIRARGIMPRSLICANSIIGQSGHVVRIGPGVKNVVMGRNLFKDAPCRATKSAGHVGVQPWGTFSPGIEAGVWLVPVGEFRAVREASLPPCGASLPR